jgi:hypothetical protein
MHSGCTPPDPRPTYQELLAEYGPTPDCLNRDQHISYLLSLKNKPMRTGDEVTEGQYNQAVDLYVERLKWYCDPRS